MTLSRSTGLKPGAFKRGQRKEANAVVKLRKCAVKSCRKEFMPAKPFETWCSPDCGTILALTKLEKGRAGKAKAERVADRVKKAKFKTRGEWIAEAQVAFNAFIRERDRQAGYPCISSGKPLDWSGNNVDAGHYRSRGSAPHMRFDERNCHAQSKQENRYASGNATDYRIGLIARIGIEAVEALEADDAPRKHTVDELKAIRDEYRAKLKDLKKNNQLQQGD
jgi:hypothetical protein